MMVRGSVFLILITLLVHGRLAAQRNAGNGGIIAGNVLEEANSKAVAGATVELLNLMDAAKGRTTTTNGNGEFSFPSLEMGVYQLKISNVGFNTLTIDSIRLRADRNDFSLN